MINPYLFYNAIKRVAPHLARKHLKKKGAPIPNVFNKPHSKRALVSYIYLPKKEQTVYHTNQIECLIALQTLDELGYVVDLIDYLSMQKINYDDYDLLYGFGCPFENYFLTERKPLKKSIFYSTGFIAEKSDRLSGESAVDFYNRQGVLLPKSVRFSGLSSFYSYRLCTGLIILGGAATLASAKHLNRKGGIYPLNAFPLETSAKVDLHKKKFNTAKKNFLWFGSSGAIHKGLDLLLNIFTKRSDLNLHVCGINPIEKEFISFYQDALYHRDNIFYYGNVSTYSDTFQEIIQKCAFCIHPSISEGGAPAVLTTAQAGLIPLISANCGLDDFSEAGWVFNAINEEELSNLIQQVSLHNDEKLREKAFLSKQIIAQKYTNDRYRKNLKQIIEHILQSERSLE